MRSPSELPWTALLLYCTAASVTATLALALALQQSRQAQRALQDAKELLETTKDSLQEPVETAQDESVITQDATDNETLQPDDLLCESLEDVEHLIPSDCDVSGLSESRSRRPKPVVDVRTLPAEDVPPELRISSYFGADHIHNFEHSAIFNGCSNVFAVIDAIHPYLVKFFGEMAWVATTPQSVNVTILKTSGKIGRDGRYAGDSDDNDSEDDDEKHSGRSDSISTTRKWIMPKTIDPAKSTEIMLYPGVDPRTFAPEKIVNLDPNAPKFGTAGTPTGKNASGFQKAMSPSARRYSYGRSSSFEDSHDHPKPPTKHLVVLPGALILGGVFDVSEGSIYIGRHVRIEPNTYIKGPCIIGDHSTIRSGAYLRGDLIIGRRVVLRGELKNALIMDHAELCHPGYCGDSICGYKSHFGNQVTTANLNLFYNTAFNEILVETADAKYNTERKKIGVVLGDYSQLGCSTVTDPCTLLQPNTIVYALTRLRKGIYGPNVIIKNKPLEKGVLEVAPLVLPSTEVTTGAVVEEEKREEAAAVEAVTTTNS